MAQTKHSPAEPSSRWIWPFELLERIGEGGMGVVYRARYVVNDREVAVKMLPDDVTSPTVLLRFERELEVLKTLKHPNIVLSFGGACEDKKKFYAMELVEGGSLEDELRERVRLPWEKVVEYGKQMCAALDYLHRNGVVHRDVKPANFLIGDQGQLKLSDFGLASVIAARKITSAGKTAGTLLYMAPEQIRGADIVARTDLYALGCVLYELLTGEPPFMGSTAAATMHMHCKAPIPRVCEVVLDCPASLEKLITQLLAKEVSERPENAVEVARALSQVAPTVTVVTKQRAIERISPLGGSDSTGVMDQPTAGIKGAAGGMSFWPFAVSLLVIAGLFTWNVSLLNQSRMALEAEALWVKAAREGEFAVKANAIVSLGQLDAVTEETLKVVTNAAQAEDAYIRLKAVQALGTLGPQAKPSTGILHKTLRSDANEEVRSAAEIAISQIENGERSGFGSYFLMLVVFSSLLAAGWWFWKQAKPGPNFNRIRERRAELAQ